MKNYPIISIVLLLFLFFNPLFFTAQVGINTTTPNSNSVLDLTSDNRGFLPPRLALSSINSPSPLSEHVAGMVVYNIAKVNDVSPGLYVNDGVQWDKINQPSDDESGSILLKQKYRGRNLQSNSFNKPTLKVPSMNLEFRFATYNGTTPGANSDNSYTYIEVRLLSAPVSDVTYYASLLWFGSSTNGSVQNVTFTPSNWDTWSNALSYNGNWTRPWGFQFQISTKDGVIPGSNDLKAGYFYGFDSFNNGAGAENETYVVAFEQY
ncbi:hypothetical protein RAH57_08145 [Chryseobacterium sp. CKR4-1]|uniref:hypothetical protein n=1 Tax=Chryseobacterium sp. CKR4-1 TaxID=3068896 RepID=UPI002796DA12|nr:hypothetical protein [Chryseobacterium sp. CKR4-1]MDQ1803956.1 hypothetical protein [Chryseobacterium sp. CKR4-1]